jgi:hypothetical protein
MTIAMDVFVATACRRAAALLDQDAAAGERNAEFAFVVGTRTAFVGEVGTREFSNAWAVVRSTV